MEEWTSGGLSNKSFQPTPARLRRFGAAEIDR